MNKEEAIKQLEIILQNIIEERKQGIASIEGIKFQDALETLLNLIQKQDKIINDIKLITYNNKPHITQEKIIEYFKKEVEKDEART